MQNESLRDIDFKEGYIAVIDKPLEWTSTDVVRKIKFALQHRLGYKKIKIGHAGTLDPLATGVLIICIGKATKMVNALQAEEKEYIADIELGATTPSYDMEHPIDCRYPTDHITREGIEQVLSGLTGERLQAHPMSSAMRVRGVRAYEFARAGEEVELKKALINIYEMEILSLEMPHLKIRVRCSKGTYIRSLANEIGQGLNSGAYLTGLRRTRSGGFLAENAYSLEIFMEKLRECETK